MGVLQSYDSLKTLCSELKLQKPDQINSVYLRKYTATVSQVFDLSPQEQSWLVNHLGHSMDVHKIHYRQTATTIERVDISKMMLLQEYNLCAKYSGKKLSEIDLKELSVTSDGGIELNIEEKQIEGVPEADPEIASVTDTDGYTPGINNVDEPDVFTFEDDNEVESHKRKKSSASNTRVSWTKEELGEVKRYFEETIEAEKTPGMKECQMAQEKSKTNGGVLHKRNWETLKKKVWNIIQKKNNIRLPIVLRTPCSKTSDFPIWGAERS